MSSIFQRLGFVSAPAQQPAAETEIQTEQQTNPSQQQAIATEQKDLDIFQSLLNNAANAKPEVAPEFKLDADVLNKAASQLNFTQGIAPELMQKAMAGDAEAFLQVINQSNQNTFKTAVSTIGQLSGEHTKQALGHQQSQLKKDFTMQMATSGIDLNTHPVVKEQVVTNAKLLAAQYPDADPKLIREQAIALTLETSKEFMRAMGMQVIDPKNPDSVAQVKEQQQTAGETDWDKIFG